MSANCDKLFYMDKRTRKILLDIVKEHIKTKNTISSNELVEKYNLGISSATVRNIMSKLEHDGYIVQPHTSAGRIPTENAYHIYLKELTSKKWSKTLRNNKANELNESLRQISEKNFKETAKLIAKFSNNAVFWAFHKYNLYYTGISNLLKQPEFVNTSLIYDVSTIIDSMDEVINNFFAEVDDNIKILIGKENPFGAFCGTILVKYKINSSSGLFGILGPIRMNYKRNIELIKYTINRINYEQKRKQD